MACKCDELCAERGVVSTVLIVEHAAGIDAGSELDDRCGVVGSRTSRELSETEIISYLRAEADRRESFLAAKRY